MLYSKMLDKVTMENLLCMVEKGYPYHITLERPEGPEWAVSDQKKVELFVKSPAHAGNLLRDIYHSHRLTQTVLVSSLIDHLMVY